MLPREAVYGPGIGAIVASQPNAATLREHPIASHTPTDDVGRVAKEARVKKPVPDEAWSDEARRAFDGEGARGQDLVRA